MCGSLKETIQRQYPSFGSREWVIYFGVIFAIIAGNVINLIYNVVKYQVAAQNPVTALSQVTIQGKFPAFTLGICMEIVDRDYVGFVNHSDPNSVQCTNISSGDKLPVRSVFVDAIYDYCWLIDVPAITLALPKPKTKPTGSDPNPTPPAQPDGFFVGVKVTSFDNNLTQLEKSRILAVFVGLPYQTAEFPADFDPSDFENVFQIFAPGYVASLPVSYKEATAFGAKTPTPSFPLGNLRLYYDVVQGDNWNFEINARALNRVKTVTKEDTTFGLGALFAALLSIVNISLTVFALIFPTAPLVVQQTYFRFKEPAKFDPTKLEGKAAEDFLVQPKSPSRAASRANSRPSSPAPKDEVALTSVPAAENEHQTQEKEENV